MLRFYPGTRKYFLSLCLKKLHCPVPLETLVEMSTVQGLKVPFILGAENFKVQKFMVEELMVQKFMVEKIMVKMFKLKNS